MVEDIVKVFSPVLKDLFLILIRELPSTLRRGEEPDDWGLYTDLRE